MKYDYDFRPETYWNDKAVTVNIAGQWRRERIRQAMADGTLDCLPAEIFQDHLETSGASADDMMPDKIRAFAGLLSGHVMDERAMAGMFSPGGLGGEYLPSYADGEVEIARVVVASTTTDVIAIRARQIDGWIAYRIVDEYAWGYELNQWYSREPLTFGEFLEMLNSSYCRHDQDFIGGLILESSNHAYMNGCDREAHYRFSLVESEFYPQIGEWVDDLWDAWRHYERPDANLDEDWIEREVTVLDGQWDGIPNKKYEQKRRQRPYVQEVVEAFVSKLHCLVANTIGQEFIEDTIRSSKDQTYRCQGPFSDRMQETKIEILDQIGIQAIILEAAKWWESEHDSQLDLESLGGYDLYMAFGEHDHWKWSCDGEDEVFEALFEKARTAVG